MRRGAVPRPVFLGGLISALLCALVFDLDQYDAVAWAALLPLLVSLDRNVHRPARRFLHGASFGLFLALWHQGWFFRALSGGSSDPAASSQVEAALGAALYWSAASAFYGALGLAVGPILRWRSTVAVLVSIPTLWWGLEVARAEIVSSGMSAIADWVSLGYAIGRGHGGAQIAAVVGVHGLSAALVLCSTALLLALRSRRAMTQALYCAVALSVAVGVEVGGRVSLMRAEENTAIRADVGIVSQTSTTAAFLLEFANAVAASTPELILWPQVVLEDLESANVDPVAGGDARVRIDVEGFLAQLASAWTNEAPERGDRPGRVLLTGDGRLIASYRSPPAGDSDPAPPDASSAPQDADVYAAANGTFSLGDGTEFCTAKSARERTKRGAQLLVGAGPTSPAWGRRGHRQWTNALSYRAIENRRWLSFVSPTGGGVVDAYGNVALDLPYGFDSAAVETIAFRSSTSFYTRHGATLEAAVRGGAAVVVLIAIVSAWRRRRAAPAEG